MTMQIMLLLLEILQSIRSLGIEGLNVQLPAGVNVNVFIWVASCHRMGLLERLLR